MLSDQWYLFIPFLVFVVIAVVRITAAAREQREKTAVQYAVSDMVNKRPPQPSPPPPSAWKRFQFFWRRSFNSRAAGAFEYRNRFLADVCEIESLFPCPRLPLGVKVQIESVKAPVVKALLIDRGDGYKTAHFRCRMVSQGRLHHITITTFLTKSVKALSVAFGNTDDEFKYRCEFRFEVLAYADYPSLRDGYKYLNEGRIEAAVNCLHKYETFATNNPWVNITLARYCITRKDWRPAASYALTAMVNGELQAGPEIYAYARHQSGFDTSREEIDELLKREAKWELDRNAGYSVLRESREITCGLNGHRLSRQHQIFRVRRSAAARIISRVSFTVTPGDELLLHSALRVLRVNGEITTVGDENLTYTDSESRNAAITTKQEKRAVWILPDLYTGDVVEWSADTLSRDSRIDGGFWPFEVDSLFSYTYPTLEGKIDVIVEGDLELAFYHTHPDLVTSSSEEPVDGTRVYHFSGERYVPVRNSGFDFGDLFLNPRTGFAPRDGSWKTVAASIRSGTVGKNAAEDMLPADIKALLENHQSERAKLEAVFYWIRDKLKYGVFHKAEAMIGKRDRAQAIVKSGFADCKDRSYLLHLTCDELGIENQFYMTSAKYGSAIEELPADQFDHVSLRAKVDGKWLYLDPTNSNCLFGSVPYWYQGMKSLILDDGGTIITLPEDEPQQNLLVIREVLDRIDDGWVAGSFFIRSRGQTARLFEEHWKVRTLSHDRHLVAAQQAIEAFMPRVIIDRFDQLASTSESDTFTVSGKCRRARCNSVGEQRVAAIEWNLPLVPLDKWRGIDFGTMFAFHFPLVVELDIAITNSLAQALRELSHTEGYTGGDPEILQHCERRADAIAIHRTVTIKHKFMRGDAVATEMPRFFEALEKALSLTCVFER